MVARGPRYPADVRRTSVMVGLYLEPSVAILIGQDVMTKLAWTPGQHVVVAEGCGPDAGLLQIALSEQNADSYCIYNNHTADGERPGYIKINTKRFKHHTLPKGHIKSAPVTFQQSGGTLTVLMPDWVKARTQSENQKDAE